MTAPLTHLQKLEAESIFIIRETVATTENPVMLYSIGKDSAVMLHLALKAFAPGKLPFPLLHVDTTWKFREMIEFRDRRAAELGVDLIVHINQDGVAAGVNPFDSGSRVHTDVMKTEGLKQALAKYRFDAAFGGARRDGHGDIAGAGLDELYDRRLAFVAFGLWASAIPLAALAVKASPWAQLSASPASIGP